MKKQQKRVDISLKKPYNLVVIDSNSRKEE